MAHADDMGAEGLGADGLDERFRRALDSILDLVVVERAIRDRDGAGRRLRDRVDEQRAGRCCGPAAGRS